MIKLLLLAVVPFMTEHRNIAPKSEVSTNFYGSVTGIVDKAYVEGLDILTLPEKWALSNVTNESGEAVGAADVGAYTREQSDSLTNGLRRVDDIAVYAYTYEFSDFEYTRIQHDEGTFEIVGQPYKEVDGWYLAYEFNGDRYYAYAAGADDATSLYFSHIYCSLVAERNKSTIIVPTTDRLATTNGVRVIETNLMAKIDAKRDITDNVAKSYSVLGYDFTTLRSVEDGDYSITWLYDGASGDRPYLAELWLGETKVSESLLPFPPPEDIEDKYFEITWNGEPDYRFYGIVTKKFCVATSNETFVTGTFVSNTVQSTALDIIQRRSVMADLDTLRGGRGSYVEPLKYGIVALGASAKAYGATSIAIGAESIVTNSGSTSIGYGAHSHGPYTFNVTQGLGSWYAGDVPVVEALQMRYVMTNVEEVVTNETTLLAASPNGNVVTNVHAVYVPDGTGARVAYEDKASLARMMTDAATSQTDECECISTNMCNIIAPKLKTEPHLALINGEWHIITETEEE